MKRFVRWYVSDFTVGFFVGAVWVEWGLTWKAVAVTLGVMFVGRFVQAWVEE